MSKYTALETEDKHLIETEENNSHLKTLPLKKESCYKCLFDIIFGISIIIGVLSLPFFVISGEIILFSCTGTKENKCNGYYQFEALLLTKEYKSFNVSDVEIFYETSVYMFNSKVCEINSDYYLSLDDIPNDNHDIGYYNKIWRNGDICTYKDPEDYDPELYNIYINIFFISMIILTISCLILPFGNYN